MSDGTNPGLEDINENWLAELVHAHGVIASWLELPLAYRMFRELGKLSDRLEVCMSKIRAHMHASHSDRASELIDHWEHFRDLIDEADHYVVDDDGDVTTTVSVCKKRRLDGAFTKSSMMGA